MDHTVNPFLRIACALFLALTAGVGAADASTIIDQTDTSCGLACGGFLTMQYAIPIGQSFTPALDSLNFVGILS